MLCRKGLFAAILILAGIACMGKDGPPLVFKEEMRVEGDSAANPFPWSHNVIQAVDGKGRLYVADLQSQDILVYDQSGAFLKRIAQRGPGPAEFKAIRFFTVLEDDALMVFDMSGGIQGRFKRFDENWNYQSMVATRGFSQLLSSVTVSPDGARIGAHWSDVDPDTGTTIVRHAVFDAMLEVLAVFNEVEQQSDMGSMEMSQDAWTEILLKGTNVNLSGRDMIAFGHQGQVFTAHSERYEVIRWDDDLKKQQAVYTRATKPTLYSSEELSTLVRLHAGRVKASLPTPLQSNINDQTIRRVRSMIDDTRHKPQVLGLLPMPDGGLLVMRSVDANTRESTADLFSKDGAYLGQVSLPNFAFISPDRRIRMIFRNDRAYAMTTDENEQSVLVRYRYTYR